MFFDYSGTLFRLQQDESWLNDFTDGGGEPFDLESRTEVLRRLTAPVDGGIELAPEFQQAWDRRDLDPEQHRKSNLEVLRLSGVTDRAQAEALYARLVDPLCWTPYPDTAEVLQRLRDQGVRIAVISNIAFDIRPAFQRLGVHELVDEYLLSYLEGVIKPDAEIFRRACARVGVEPGEALMIGDSAEADGAAAELGCAVELVEPVPTDQRPDALLKAVTARGLLPGAAERG